MPAIPEGKTIAFRERRLQIYASLKKRIIVRPEKGFRILDFINPFKEDTVQRTLCKRVRALSDNGVLKIAISVMSPSRVGSFP